MRTGLAVIGVTDNGRTPAELVEVAVVHIDGSEIVRGPLRWLVRPEALPTRQAVAVHGVRRADLVLAPPWAEVAERIVETLEDRRMVAHEVAAGYGLLRRYMPDWQPPAVVDLARFAEVGWRGLSSYDLHTLAEVAGLDPPGAPPYGAAYCAYTSARVLLALFRTDASRGLAQRLAAGEFDAAR